MKARSMNASEEGACSVRVTLEIPAALGLRIAQAITFRMAAEFVEAMDPDIEMANYKGSIYVDHGVTQEGDRLLTFIVMEAMDEDDLRRAYAVADVAAGLSWRRVGFTTGSPLQLPVNSKGVRSWQRKPSRKRPTSTSWS